MRVMDLPEDARERAMRRLWERMLGIFGATWARERGDHEGLTADIWAQGLEGLTLDQIGNGINQCAHWNEAFPPNLPQFMKLCLTSNKDRAAETSKALEHQSTPATPQTIQEAHKKVSRLSTERDKSFVDDYQALGLNARWGPLRKEQIGRYTN